jgi:cardiolipin synthase
MQALSVWRQGAGRLLRLGGGSEGNDLLLFVDGDDAYDAILAAIDAARVRVWLEVYIFEPDVLGNAVLAALVRAARRGVDVRLLIDAHGSPKMTPDVTRDLTDAGGRVVHFNPWFQGWLSATFGSRVARLKRPLPTLMRDHRKIIVVDDADGFCGGMNVSTDYGSSRHGNGLFRDTHLHIGGPAVYELARLFAVGWHHATGGEQLRLFAPAAERMEGSHVQILGSDRFRRRRGIQSALHHAVAKAEKTIRLTTPYFVPPPRLLRSLVRAARRGVDVAVLTAGLSDVPIAAAAARHLYGTLLRGGVRIYEMHGRTLHAKTASVDGIYAHVGSFNLDRWSFERNLEVCAMCLDPGFSQALDAVFERDLALCRPVELAAWEQRSVVDVFVSWLAWQVARL